MNLEGKYFGPWITLRETRIRYQRHGTTINEERNDVHKFWVRRIKEKWKEREKSFYQEILHENTRRKSTAINHDERKEKVEGTRNKRKKRLTRSIARNRTHWVLTTDSNKWTKDNSRKGQWNPEDNEDKNYLSRRALHSS